MSSSDSPTSWAPCHSALSSEAIESSSLSSTPSNSQAPGSTSSSRASPGSSKSSPRPRGGEGGAARLDWPSMIGRSQQDSTDCAAGDSGAQTHRESMAAGLWVIHDMRYDMGHAIGRHADAP
eukprot:8953960-Pyramimonas_sp.AAC.1